jgi:hypothetical protein
LSAGEITWTLLPHCRRSLVDENDIEVEHAGSIPCERNKPAVP